MKFKPSTAHQEQSDCGEDGVGHQAVLLESEDHPQIIPVLVKA